MKDKDDKIGLNYNYQVAIDSKNDFIVAQKLINLPTDHHQLIPMIENVKMNLRKHTDYYTADNGYLTDEAVEYLYKHNIKAIIPDKDPIIKNKNKKKIKKFSKANFKYNSVNDTYICPNNQILEYQNNRRINKKLQRVYSTKKM
jgi:kynurenine formamidase